MSKQIDGRLSTRY